MQLFSQHRMVVLDNLRDEPKNRRMTSHSRKGLMPASPSSRLPIRDVVGFQRARLTGSPAPADIGPALCALGVSG
jgi:hypothetical protein